MKYRVILEDGRSIVILPVHFDVDSHFISLSLFVDTAAQIAKISEDLGLAVFGPSYTQEALVFPPDEGSFLTRIGIVVGVAWGFGATDPGSSFIEGLTGRSTSAWTKAAGELIREQAAGVLHRGTAEDSTSSFPDVGTLACNLAIVEATRQFMTREEEALAVEGVSKDVFRDAYEARNDFYAACARDSDVHGIGYTESPSFPIRRSDFATLQVSLPPKKDPEDVDPWTVEIAVLDVTSPNWDRRDHKKRHWKAYENRQDRLFTIEDEEFWRRANKGSLRPQVGDRLRVQWAFKGGRKKKDARVLRVLEFNGEKLAPPLDNDALRAILGSVDSSGSAETQWSLDLG